MKRQILAFVALGLLLIFSRVTADANSETVDFPSSGTNYFSATNGSGIIPAGGQSGFMWTQGDYVTQTFSTIGLDSVSSLGVNFQYQNYLGGFTEAVNIYINGNYVSNFIAPDTGNSGDYDSIIQTIAFSPISGSNIYTLSMVLQDTIPGGGGSIAFLDGGKFTLTDSSSAVPEPATMLLLCSGLIGLAGYGRKKLKK